MQVNNLKGHYWDVLVSADGKKVYLGRLQPALPPSGEPANNDVFESDLEVERYVQRLAHEGDEEALQALAEVAQAQIMEEKQNGESQ